MERDRLTALTDGVVAIIVTIMVLEMRPPHEPTLVALAQLWPVFLSYLLSFIYVAIYWNNHHHFFQLVERVDGALLWANMHLLFWLALIPFTTAWMGENHFAAAPTALYGVSLLMPAIAWMIMQATIVHAQGPDSALRQALGRDLKGKLSPFFYAAGIGLSFVSPLLADLLYAGVAAMWLVPDRRVEAAFAASPRPPRKGRSRKD
jgi:uncharacterized membrane protein